LRKNREMRKKKIVSAARERRKKRFLSFFSRVLYLYPFAILCAQVHDLTVHLRANVPQIQSNVPDPLYL
jgi:hypothetical protein